MVKAMTLCIVWRDGSNIKFVSDSRVTFTLNGEVSDSGIKVVRIPFNIYGPTEPSGAKPPLILSGDLGMAFAGSPIGAFMVKEALAELLFSIQVIPTFHDYGMDGIADFIFCAYEVISKDLCAALLEKGRTCIVFAGYCPRQKQLRAFRIETDDQNERHKSEVLACGENIEIFGSGRGAALKLIKNGATERDIVKSLQAVIEDPDVPSVGGNIQYGSFLDSKFRPVGVMKISNRGMHYWRGSLDLNDPDFEACGLIPNLPLLDLS
jgi:hypothetical protein